MTIKSILVATALLVSPQLFAANLYPLTTEPLTINKCSIIATDNPLDLALLNQGYFVVSHGKKDSELLFTRFGRMLLDRDYYVRSNDGDYLLAVNKKSDPNHLSKIKIPMKNLEPKASSKINLGVNLPAMAIDGDDYQISTIIYDSLSKSHDVIIKSEKITTGIWKVRVSVDEIALVEGKLQFNTSGALSKQEGLSHILWPDDYGLHELKIDFKASTQYASPFTSHFVLDDGYPLGVLRSFEVTRDGEIGLFYSNGQYRALPKRIAVALFTNPGYLDQVTSRLYRASEKSGQPRIHWVNGEYSILSGGFEEEGCLTK